MKIPEVQVWFDQGNTLLHSFWFEEAERAIFSRRRAIRSATRTTAG